MNGDRRVHPNLFAHTTCCVTVVLFHGAAPLCVPVVHLQEDSDEEEEEEEEEEDTDEDDEPSE